MESDSDLLKNWERDGFLILKQAFSDSEIDSFNDAIDRLWAERHEKDFPYSIDFWEGELFGQRMRLNDAPKGSRSVVHKLSQLYLDMEECRRLSLSPVLVEKLYLLIDAPPLQINSLLFEKGSQQPDHFDTYHMPPPNDGKLIVTSICLEDVQPDAGPVHYYPGSHLIPPYVFSDGQIRMTDRSEGKAATEYANAEIAKRGIKKVTLKAKKGDVLIWHGQLYHGGGSIKNHELTRKTLVSHYWREQDLLRRELLRKYSNNSYYMKRPHSTPQNLV